jgi:hypothetical protein
MSTKSSAQTLNVDLNSKVQEDDVKIEPEAQVERKTRRSGLDPSVPPPDGGLLAWSKVFGCFLLYSNIWRVSTLLLVDTLLIVAGDSPLRLGLSKHIFNMTS